MSVILIMLAGVLVGYKWFPEKFAERNVKFQMLCTTALIFAMGVKLGSRENFVHEITDMGLASLVFAVVPIIVCVILVYFLTEKWLKKGSKADSEQSEGGK